MFLPIFVPCVAVMFAEADASTHDAEAIVKKWMAAQEGVHAVHAKFKHIEYNHVFQTVTESRGEIYCTSPTDGYCSLFPRSEKNASEWITVGNERYRPRHRSAYRMIWDGDAVIFVDEESKQYDRWEGPFFGAQRFPSLVEMLPFLPGLPDKKAITGWTFRIVSETDAKVHLQASPPESQSEQFTSCDLMLQKPEWSLSAVRYSVGPSMQTVFVFQSVERNPDKMPNLDLNGYTESKPVSSD